MGYELPSSELGSPQRVQHVLTIELRRGGRRWLQNFQSSLLQWIKKQVVEEGLLNANQDLRLDNNSMVRSRTSLHQINMTMSTFRLSRTKA